MKTASLAMDDALIRLRRGIPTLMDRLEPGIGDELDAWCRIIDQKLLPRLSPDFPLTVAICGGGSSGKSTLFNTLAGAHISPVGGRAGLNRRVLVAAHPDQIGRADILPVVFAPFGVAPQPLSDSQALTRPGDPLYIPAENIPKNLVLLDTPDFDTGARGTYTNREEAEKALDTADILIYVFTNSNYNNRDNTDFIARMLTGIGQRKCFLVYRVYPSFHPEEIREHALTVARNLYGTDAEKYLLGIYRSDEDNAVAANQNPPRIRPLAAEDPDLNSALTQIDSGKLRLELFSSILTDVLSQADQIVQQAELSARRLQVYQYALQKVHSRCVRETLHHIPMDRVIRRFADIWQATDPAPIKFMRRTGQVLDLPLRAVVKSFRWIKHQLSDEPPLVVAPVDYPEQAETDLMAASTELYRFAMDPDIQLSMTTSDPESTGITDTVERIRSSGLVPQNAKPEISTADDPGRQTLRVPAHPATAEARKALHDREWKTILAAIMDQKAILVDISDTVELELKRLVEDFRGQMGWGDHIRQMFSAALNVIPATAAVTYILATGDPVGATGIKVKLAGLFGLRDLYALVAIPATASMKKADQNQLEAMLGPLAQTWLNDRLIAVSQLLEQHITGDILRAAQDTLTRTGNEITDLKDDLEQCRSLLNRPRT
jgi:energy-coupling factor transporter ATP-binding protein EcfA2